jgi:PAS domain S-box-containing protein
MRSDARLEILRIKFSRNHSSFSIMTPISGQDSSVVDNYFPPKLIGFTVVICALPFLLNQLGVDFGSQGQPFPPSSQPIDPGEWTDAMHKSLSGSFTHTILEWSAFCTAVFTVLLSFVHYSIRKDVTTPIIGVALICAGSMDAFHTLAADRLIEAVADNLNLIPFTWAICRVFNVLILIVGAMILLSRKNKTDQGGLKFIISTSLVFGAIAYGIINICATSDRLPQTMFPDSLITRPWDIAPLVLYLFAGLFIFPLLYKKEKSYITAALIISVIPHSATQLYMAFGSTALFDNNFNIAHFLKIIGYFIPFLGLSLEYIKTYRQEEWTVRTLQSTQAELQKSSAQLQATLNSTIDAIITIDEKGIVQTANHAVESIFQYHPSWLVNKNINLLMPEPYRSEHDQYLKNYLETGVSRIIGVGREVTGLRRDGTNFPADLAISELYLGETRMFTGILRDISEQKKTENERKKVTATLDLTRNEFEKSRKLLRATLDGIAEAIITIDEEGFIRSVNPAVENVFQYPPSFLVGTNIKILMPEPYRSEHDQYIKNYLESGVKKVIGIRREAVGLRRDGTTFPLDLAISEIHLGETRMFTGIIRDITERKKAEEKLAKAKNKTQLILDSAGEGICGLDLEGNMTFINPAAEKILGYKEEELRGKLLHALIHHSKPDGSPYRIAESRILAVFKDGRARRESGEVFWRKEDTPVPVEYVSVPIWENEKLVGAVVTFKDISQHKRTERIINAHTKDLKRANEMLCRSNQELDDFAYIVSHDLKEPLRGIYNYSGFIKEDYFDKLDEEGKSKLETLERLSKRMEALIDSILYYARLGREEAMTAPVDLNRVLAETLENMQILIKESKVNVRLPDDFPEVHGNETRVAEVFQNLIANAIKYNDKPEKWVEIGYILNDNRNGRGKSMELDSEETPDTNGSSPIFYVKDNGIGILEKHFESLFRIFKRLNGRNKFSDGTGAGTTIVKKIIEQHHGNIWVESTVGEGTTFYFTLGGKNGNENYQSKSFDSYR